MDKMEYKGYQAEIEFSKTNNGFIGTVLGLNDILVFEGSSIKELQDGFKKSIDDYLRLCEQLGKEPDKTYKGQFNVRTAPEVHRDGSLLK